MTTPPRLLFINRSYWPDGEATGQLLTDLCEDLAARGFSVKVMCGTPEQLSPAARRTTHRNGVRIRRLSHTRFPKHSNLGRILNLVSFTAAAFVAHRSTPPPDVVITETDPFFLPAIGRRWKRRFGTRFVAYLQDVYPDVAIALGKAGDNRLTRRLRRWLAECCAEADRVVVLSEGMKQRAMENGIPEDTLTIVPNWTDCDLIDPAQRASSFRDRHGLFGKFVAMYSGNLGLAHELSPIITAAQELQADERVRFVFVGGGVQLPSVQREVERCGLDNVMFLPFQPRERLGESLCAADVHLVSSKSAVEGCVMPSKLYGVFAAGTPVLAVCPPEGDVARIVEGSDVGYVCDVDAADCGQQLANAIRETIGNPAKTNAMGIRARRLAESQFDRVHQTRAFERVLRDVLGDDVSERDGLPSRKSA